MIKNIKESKVILIGLDSATFDIIKPWIEQGKLPSLEKIMREGVYGDLTSTIIPLTPPAWTSAMTGKNPGKHGIFDFIMRQRDSYEHKVISRYFRKSEALWNILSREGKKVIIINEPISYPPEEVNGVMISGMLTPSLDSDFTFPKSIKDEIFKRFGRYRINPEKTFAEGMEDAFYEDVVDLTKIQADVGMYLLKKYKWNFFMQVFMGTDVITHEFWRYYDATHPKYDPEKSKLYGNRILEFYQKMDKIIEEFLKLADDDTVIVIMSDHGQGPLYKHVYLNNWLKDLDMLVLKKDILTNIRHWMFKKGLSVENIYRIIVRFGFGWIAGLIPTRKRDSLVMSTVLRQSSIDWSKTKAYSDGHYGQIYINLKGREPDGIVEPNEEYEEVRDYLIKELYNLKDSQGEKFVDKVYKKEEIYHGGYIDQAPDLIVIMRDMSYSAFPVLGFVSNSLVGDPIQTRSSEHRMNGILLMKGRNIRKGVEIKNAQIVDIAPTLLYLMGLPIPEDMDGKVLTDAFERNFLDTNKITIKKIEKKERDIVERDKLLSKDEEEEIKEKLKGLGYL